VQAITKAFPSFTSVTAVMNLDLLPIPLLTIAGCIVFFFASRMPTTVKNGKSDEEK
jgi:hypothetical protein